MLFAERVSVMLKVMGRFFFGLSIYACVYVRLYAAPAPVHGHLVQRELGLLLRREAIVCVCVSDPNRSV